MDQKLNFAGIAAAVAGVVGLLGVYADWWETADAVYKGTADASGSLALAMSLGLFVFALASLWGTTRADSVAPGAESSNGIWISALAGAIGIAAGVLAMRDVRAPENTAGDGSS